MRRTRANNKIAIPWYRRNVRFKGIGDMENNSMSLDLPFPRPRIRTRTRPQPVRQPVRVPVTSPVNAPVTAPSMEPNPITNPIPEPVPNPIKSPVPNPYHPDSYAPPIPVPIPERRPNPIPTPQAPAFPPIPAIPTWINDPSINWSQRWEDEIKGLPAASAEPVREPKNAVEKTLDTVLTPVISLFILNEVKNNFVEVNITDPVYNVMLNDPVLGAALREAEKSEMDMVTVASYFANYNWDKMDVDQMTKDLTALVGAAGAARIIIFFVGRKVAFRM